MSKTVSALWLSAVALLSAGGLAFSVWLTVSNFSLIWLIIAPVLVAFYQSPAALVYRMWKRRRRAAKSDGAPDGIRTRVAALKGRCPRPD